MADSHYGFDRNRPGGFRLGRGHQALDDTYRYLVDERDTMVQMRSGDGSQDSHYATITAAYGFSDDAESHAAFLELDSVVGQLMIAGVVAAVRQFLARFRN